MNKAKNLVALIAIGIVLSFFSLAVSYDIFPYAEDQSTCATQDSFGSKTQNAARKEAKTVYRGWPYSYSIHEVGRYHDYCYEKKDINSAYLVANIATLSFISGLALLYKYRKKIRKNYSNNGLIIRGNLILASFLGAYAVPLSFDAIFFDDGTISDSFLPYMVTLPYVIYLGAIIAFRGKNKFSLTLEILLLALGALASFLIIILGMFSGVDRW